MLCSCNVLGGILEHTTNDPGGQSLHAARFQVSEREAPPEDHYCRERQERDQVGARNACIRTGHYSGTINYDGKSSISTRSTAESAEGITPLHGCTCVASRTISAEASYRHRSPKRRTSSKSRARSCKSVNRNKLCNDNSGSVPCTCRTHKTSIAANSRGTYVRDQQLSCSARSSDEQGPLKVVTRETIRRREFLCNLNLPDGIRINHRGKLVEDRGVSAEEANFRKKVRPVLQKYHEPTCSQPMSPSPISYRQKAASVRMCADTTTGLHAAGLVAVSCTSQPQQLSRSNSQLAEVEEIRPKSTSRHSLPESTSHVKIVGKARKYSAINCKCPNETRCRSGLTQELTQVQVECISCKEKKWYIVCKACFMENRIQYCNDCRFRSGSSVNKTGNVNDAVCSVEDANSIRFDSIYPQIPQHSMHPQLAKHGLQYAHPVNYDEAQVHPSVTRIVDSRTHLGERARTNTSAEYRPVENTCTVSRTSRIMLKTASDPAEENQFPMPLFHDDEATPLPVYEEPVFLVYVESDDDEAPIYLQSAPYCKSFENFDTTNTTTDSKIRPASPAVLLHVSVKKDRNVHADSKPDTNNTPSGVSQVLETSVSCEAFATP
ncbi:uncharacterized protein LOC135385285 [Ornithodoros turicata]|uniref:uncharacterized protein LOC135385285 n=1 Tax=Ornithodoros turicata TaxID=34597 RepID=UPI00313A348E